MILFFSLGLTSCDKQLDKLRPHNVTIEDQQFTSPDGFTKAANGLYALISNSSAVELSSFNYDDMQVLLAESRGNNIKTLIDRGTATSFDLKYLDAFDYQNSAVKDYSWGYLYWRGSYNIIYNLNKLLANVKDGEQDPKILQAKADAFFIRAYVYFNMVRVFGRPYYQNPDKNLGVMLITTDNNGNGFAPPRATVKEVYSQVVSDLTEAAKLFSGNRSNSFAGKHAANALLSRVYLYMGGTFEQPNAEYNRLAKEAADKVINEGGYTLLQNIAYTNFYNADNMGNKETIFSINHAYSNGSISQLFAYPPQANYTGGTFRPSSDLFNLLEANDLRKKFYVKNVIPGNNLDTLAIVKYMYKYQAIYSPSPSHYLRLAEMYLNRAEANVKLGNDAAALADVNIIRVRAGLAPVAFTGKELFDEILKQRRIELAFEGHNSFDYFRNGLPMVRNYNSVSTPAMTILATDPKVVMRIPQEEIMANPNLKQNEQ